MRHEKRVCKMPKPHEKRRKKFPKWQGGGIPRKKPRHSRENSDSPPTFVGGETSSAEFTPPRNFRLPAAIYRSRKMPGFAAVNCCGLFRPRQMSGASKPKKAASFPAAFSFFLPKLKTMNRVYLESCVFGKIVCIFPSETGGGADCPAVITQNAFQI